MYTIVTDLMCDKVVILFVNISIVLVISLYFKNIDYWH